MAENSSSQTLSKKLGLKPGYRVLTLSAPNGILRLLEPLPEGVTIEKQARPGAFDAVILFAVDKAALDAQLDSGLSALKPGGMFWAAYPKKSSKIKTDLSRDEGWEGLHARGYEGVTLVSLDDTWSVYRSRPLSEIKSRK